MQQFLALFLMVFLPLGPAMAQGNTNNNPDPTCNPEFYEIMKARAWMGGERDMEAAQKLIKGGRDNLSYSVLSLVCFNDVVGRAGGYTSTLVNPTVSTYINNNFSGGVCASMSALWDMAKCENLSKDDFYTLKQLVTTDIRGCGGSRQMWDAAYKLTNPAYGTQQSGDTTKTYLEILKGTGGCGPAIPTGIEVQPSPEEGQQPEQPYKDAVCMSPTCSFSKQSKTCQ